MGATASACNWWGLGTPPESVDCGGRRGLARDVLSKEGWWPTYRRGGSTAPAALHPQGSRTCRTDPTTVRRMDGRRGSEAVKGWETQGIWPVGHQHHQARQCLGVRFEGLYTPRMRPRLNFYSTCELRPGLTQARLAEGVGVREGLIAKWERSRSRPISSEITRYATAVDVDSTTIRKEIVRANFHYRVRARRSSSTARKAQPCWNGQPSTSSSKPNSKSGTTHPRQRCNDPSGNDARYLIRPCPPCPPA